MGPKVDVDDLLDSTAVAELLGLGSRRTVSVYARRYEDFPQPIVTSDAGRCLLWRRQDIEAWARRRHTN